MSEVMDWGECSIDSIYASKCDSNACKSGCRCACSCPPGVNSARNSDATSASNTVSVYATYKETETH